MKNDKKISPVAVIGVGCLFPKAPGVKEYWKLLSHGEDAIREVPESHWKANDFYNENPKTQDHTYCTRGGYLSPVSFNPAEFGIPPNILEATDTSQLLSLVVAKMTLDDAGYGSSREFNKDKVSVMLGATGTQELVIPLGARLGHPKWRKALEDSGIPPEKTKEVMERISDSYVEWQENSFPGLLGNVITGRIANRFDLRGTNTVLDSACASSLSALNLAFMELQTGRSDMVLSGGVDALNDIFMHMCFAQTGVLSASGDSKPFSDTADGTVLGEGIGMVLLKRLEDAEKDGDKIYAVIKSVGASSDGKSLSIYAPSAKGQAKAVQMAYTDADIDPSTVELVEAHGTGTKGDMVEFEGLSNVFAPSSEKNNWCALGSVKSMIGHAKAAAGIAGLIKGILSLHHKVIPPTLKINKPDPKLDITNSPFYLSPKTRPWLSKKDHPRRCGVTASGFGGSNFHVVLEEYLKEKNMTAWDGSVEIVSFSGKTPDDLKKVITSFNEKVEGQLTLEECGADFSYEAMLSRKHFNGKHPHRLLLIVNKTDTPKEIINKAINTLEKNNGSIEKHNMFYGTSSEDKGKLAYIFPGQGSQYLEMGKDLINVFPEARKILETANTIFDKADTILSDIIFPLPDHIVDPKACETTLRNTDNAQPAIGAVSMAMNRVLSRFGLKPDAACGHSFGELSALCAAGWIDEKTFLSLAVARGHYMASCGNDAGTMLAVKAPVSELETVIKNSGIDVVLANRNSHEQGVLSGSFTAIEEAEKFCKKQGYRTTKLPVAAAFHSKLVEAAAKPFSNELKNVNIIPTKIPVFSNTTGEEYPTDKQEDIKAILGNQLLNPVKFVDNIENLYQSGVRTFVEVGPKPVLTGLVKSILKDKQCQVISMDASSGRKFGVTDLAKILCNLASNGFPVDLTQWEDKVDKPEKQMMSVSISGVNHRSEIKERPKTSFEIPQTQITMKKPIQKLQNDEITAVKAAKPNNKNVSTRQESKVIMNSKTTTQPTVINDALKVVQEGLKSMQAIQSQTAQAHNRFLEAQTEAGKTLQIMMEKTQQMANISCGVNPVLDSSQSHNNVSMPSSTQDHHNISENIYTPAPVRKKVAVKQQETIAVAETAQVMETVSSILETELPTIESVPKPTPDSLNHKIETTMLDVVSQLTGYPVEMLGLDMDIEADLGIDSIKRVEILSTFEEKMPDIPGISPEVMSSLKTLGEITTYLLKLTGGESVSVSPPEQAPETIETQTILLDVVSQLTGYPVEMLGLDMDLEADLGIDSIKRVEILSTFEEQVPDLPSANPETMSTLKTLGEISSYLAELSGGNTQASNSLSVATPSVDASAITGNLLEVVSELTGYPVEMLGLEMDIEADLGIDSIKRVEILSTFEEKMPDIPSIDPEAMGTLKTLGQIAGYLTGLTPSATDSADQPQSDSIDTSEIEKNLLDVVSQLTGYPVEMLGLDMDIEADLGIDSIKRVEIMSEFEERMPNLPAVNPDVMGTLKTLGQIKEYISGSTSTNQVKNDTEPASQNETPAVTARIDRQIVTFADRHLNEEIPVTIASDRKVYITDDKTGLAKEIAKELNSRDIHATTISVNDKTPDAGGLVILPDLKRKRSSAWNKKDEDFLLNAFALSNKTAPALFDSAANGGAVFATITKLDGKFGFNDGKLSAPVTGGLAGLSKTASIEWDKVNCKAIDISPDCTDNQVLAKRIVAELLNKGPVEIGLTSESRFIPELESVDIKEGELNLSEKDVVVISGGAKGVTAATAIALAQKSKPSIVLLGRSSAPAPEPEWLSPLKNDSDIKKALLEHEFKGQQVTPVQVDKSFRKHMGNREITQNIEKLAKAGSTAIYYSVDVRDDEKINSIMEEIRSKYGPIKAVIHGAGVLEDRLIIDKTTEQFDKVYGTKVKGLEILLKATQKDKLKHLVLFSSVSARLGNTGQVDYSMANEVLNKIGRHYAASNPECHVISMNWGPWDGGMVNPALKKEFARKNIELIPIKEGAECLVAEMTTPMNDQIEIVIGATMSPSDNKRKALSSTSEKKIQEDKLSLSFKKDVDTNSYPILDAHMINNKPVVPFALMTEWYGHGALHENPGFNLHGIDEMRILKGIQIDQPPKTIRLMSGKASKKGSFFEVDVEIRNGHKGGVDVIHSRAKAVLSDVLPKPPEYKISDKILAGKYSKTMEEAYDTILFHGPELKGIEEVRSCSSAGMVAKVSSAPPPSEWISEPLRTNWVADPLVLDSAYQMAILWCYEEKGIASLPSYSESYRQYTREFPEGGVTAVMEVNEVSDHKMKSDFTFLNSSNEVVATISGYEAIMDGSLLDSFNNDEKNSDSKDELFDREKLLAYAIGKPSEAFGAPYEVFDNERIIARLPGPPYFFMDRVINIDHKPWDLKAGGWIESEYDIPSNEWYFRANRTEAMPFCVLLEIALQPCGWLAAYAGSALRSEKQLKFRNLGGSAILHRDIKKDDGTLMMRTRLTKVAEAAGMIIEEFDIQVWQGGEIVYEGETNFGFFTNETMEQQVGIRNTDEILYIPSPEEAARGKSYELSKEAPLTPDDVESDGASPAAMPSKALLMLDNIDLYIPDGGPQGLGYVLGSKNVDPEEWFFKAHFYQDPVCPGSLGIESFIQLIKFASLDKWSDLAETHEFEFVTSNEHQWIYRGQVIPRNKKIEVTAIITGIKEGNEPEITANGYLRVDGLLIYEMKNFGLKLKSSSN